METMPVVRYQGPAVLIPKDSDSEYACGVRVSVSHDIGKDFDDPDIPLWDVRMWEADVEGEHPCPPYGEATLRLPDGSTGGCVFNAVQPTESPLWKGSLAGMGRSPVE